MPYRICKSIEIESGHMLSKHADKCKYPHGHSRKVEFLLEADQLNQNEMIIDYKIIKNMAEDFIGNFDHSMCVNSDDPHFKQLKEIYGEHIIEFDNADPTTEVIAKRIFDLFNQKLAEYYMNPDKQYPLADGIKLVRVRVWETSSSWAEYGE